MPACSQIVPTIPPGSSASLTDKMLYTQFSQWLLNSSGINGRLNQTERLSTVSNTGNRYRIAGSSPNSTDSSAFLKLWFNKFFPKLIGMFPHLSSAKSLLILVLLLVLLFHSATCFLFHYNSLQIPPLLPWKVVTLHVDHVFFSVSVSRELDFLVVASQEQIAYLSLVLPELFQW